MPTETTQLTYQHSFFEVYRSAWLYVGAVLAFIISPAVAFTSLGVAAALIATAPIFRQRTRFARHGFAMAIGLLLGSIPWLVLALQAYLANTA